MSEQPGFLDGIIGRQITQRALEDARKKNASGRKIVSDAVGSIPTGPEPAREWGQMLGDIGYGNFSSPQAGPQGPSYGSDKEFKKNIVGESIRRNALTGGRHADAAPLEPKEPKEPKKQVAPLSDDATVTPLNSNPASPPRTAGEFGDFMKTLTADYGIKFPGEQQRNGYESIHLPGTDSNSDEFSASDAVTMGMSPQQAIDRKAGGTTEIVIGGNMGAQSGSSPAADQGDQSRVVKGFNGTEFGGEHEAPATSGLDARRRAFLDYDGEGGSMMALRAAEAAQGTIKQNGELYAVGDDGKGTRISAEGERALKKDGNQMASQEFLKNYRYVPDSPAETETADSQQPAMPSSTFGPTVDDDDSYGKLLDASKGMTGVGPYADVDAYGRALQGYK